METFNCKKFVKKVVTATALLTGLFALTGVLQPAHAQCTKFVSPTGSDSNTGTTLSSPWLTVEHAFQNVSAGDYVCFRGGWYAQNPQTGGTGKDPCITDGTYSQILRVGGTSANWITFTNYPGEMAIIQGDTRVDGQSTCSSYTGAQYVKFLGTPVLNGGLVFQGCNSKTTVACTSNTTRGLVDVMYTHDVTFDHVEIRNADYHAGLYQYGDTTTGGGYNIQVLGSYIHDNGVSTTLDHGIYWDQNTAGGNLVANCVIENNAASGMQTYGATSPAFEIDIEENTIVGNGYYGLNIDGSNHKIVNNILSQNGNANSSKQLRLDATSLDVDSNILYSTTASQQGYSNVSCTGCNITANNYNTQDPTFIDAVDHNYRLYSTSPAIGEGSSSYTQMKDKDGVTRTSTQVLGAYSY